MSSIKEIDMFLKVIDGEDGWANIRTQESLEKTETKSLAPSSQGSIIKTWLIVSGWCLIQCKSAQG